MNRVIVLSGAVSFVMGLLGATLALSLAGPMVVSAQGSTVRAHDFVLVGSDGSQIARLFERTDPVTGGTGAFLGLFQDGAARATLSYGQRDPEGVALALRDTNGNARIAVALAAGVEAGSAGDLSRIAVLDGEQRVRVNIGVDGAGSPFIELRDANGNVTWRAQ